MAQREGAKEREGERERGGGRGRERERSVMGLRGVEWTRSASHYLWVMRAFGSFNAWGSIMHSSRGRYWASENSQGVCMCVCVCIYMDGWINI